MILNQNNVLMKDMLEHHFILYQNIIIMKNLNVY